MQNIKGKGEVDYDYKQDILFFKTKNREYKKSVELDNVVLDVDKEGFITGIQIFEASKFLDLSKNVLMKIPKWEFRASVEDGIIEIRLIFQVKVRNRIIEKNPIFKQVAGISLPNSKVVCVTA